MSGARHVGPHFFDRWNDRAAYQLLDEGEAVDVWNHASHVPPEPFDIDGRARWWADAEVILIARGNTLITVLTPRQAVDRAAGEQR